jgi:hypothetical protein
MKAFATIAAVVALATGLSAPAHAGGYLYTFNPGSGTVVENPVNQSSNTVTLGSDP